LVSKGLQYVGALLLPLGGFFQGLGQRLEARRWRSARVYACWALTNAWIKLRNRLTRAPQVACPCCGWEGYDFLTIDCGTFTVPHAECPHCKAHERHRMLHLYLNRCDRAFFSVDGRVLHFAPEAHVRSLLLTNPHLRVISADYALYMTQRFPGPALQTDMQHLALGDATCELIFCLHVLEHVPDDRRGIAELHRVLKPGGVAYVMVPFMMGWPKTVEFGKPDPAIYDHVRGYSPDDFDERLAPFLHERVMPGDFVSPEELRRYRIPHDSQVIYRCTKSAHR